MTTTIKTTTRPELLVADLDGTLLHDAEVFEDRFITQRSIDTIARAHDAGMKFAIATARPVSTGLQFAEKLPVDAVIYLNGALIDFDPANSDFDMLTSDSSQQSENHLIKIGFSSQRACEVCLFLLDRMPNLKLGIVMNDVRYTNFDVRVYPPDFDISISEGVMWMLMNPQANKEHALRLLCDRLDVPLEQTAAFGDDLIDINMMSESGRGVAVANANPKVLSIADEICPPNNEDGVAQWIESQLR